MRTLAIVVVAGIAATAWWVFAEQPAPRRDGHWSVSMRAQLPGATAQPPPMQFTHCVTKADAEDPTKLVPLNGQAETPGVECKVVEQRVEGPTVSWTTQCPGAAPMTGVGRFTYSSDRYEGTMAVTVTKEGAPVTMTMTYTGERLGDCETSTPWKQVPQR